ncbi:hypothetical protein [Chitinophaga sp. 212800010-3]|uniref:hypothetical protein n=1 Tax=unclassified Chitinophaga TaxID=2619133 RepID=UPI002DED36AD|nr:Glyco-hydro-42 domain-containing protein [Chitinophaga sp. 212800010-3]
MRQSLTILAICIITMACQKNNLSPLEKKTAATVAGTNASQLSMLSLDTSNILIGVYWPPTWDYVNDLQFQRLGRTGVDMLQYVITYTESQNLTILGKCSSNNLRAIIFDGRVYGSDTDIAGMVNAYSANPGLGGYYIKDEPAPDTLNWAARIYNKILSYDAVHIPHVNLLPSISSYFTSINYETDYMQKWINLVGSTNLKYLSTDIYPFMANGTFDNRYYTELDRLRRVALANSNIKTSAYLQSVGIAGVYRRPNANELTYNVYSMLAYGIKYPAWFTYFTPPNDPNETFTNAIITPTGDTTDLFNPFVKLNKEMKALGNRLAKLAVYDVYHTGPNTPTGVETLPSNYFIQPSNSTNDLILAQCKNWYEGTGRNYTMIVNKSLTQSKTITFNIAGWITYMGEISKTNGTESQVPTPNYQVTLTFAPGEGRLFCFNPY